MAKSRQHVSEMTRFSVPATVSPEAAAVLRTIYDAGRDLPPIATPRSAFEFQRLHEEMETVFGAPNARLAEELGTLIQRGELGGVPVLRLYPEGYKPGGRTLVYLHGGSHVFLSAASTVGTPARVAKATGAEVVSVDFTRAPAARWRTVTNEVLAVCQALIVGGTEPSSVGLLGESAGGGLAAGSVLMMREQGLPLPGALWLLSPWADLSGAGDSRDTLQDWDPALSAELMAACAEAYADPTEQRTPFVSAVYGDFGGAYPPTLIQGGTRELLFSDFVRLYQGIRGAGHEAVLDIYEGMPHTFAGILGDTPESRTAIGRGAEFFQRHLGS
ncbi:alpha/beta hydrolase fold domain-containing protein [Pararhizobium sp. DWP1-1-3]|uniref:alpha/beta hydrolase fold domain-containing protein n=1 Tax=Pararhizobium sp. DWP1-1-3 TaxID=2804652 RepID=UPI003CF9A4CC